jgi:hypothetical protein
MATDIVQSLFGVTPEMYQQRQAAAADKRALALAQLDPMQRAEFNIGRSAYQLAGALGGPDPELQRISARQSIAQQIDFNDPASIQQAMTTLQRSGDIAGAMQLMQVADQATQRQALSAEREQKARQLRQVQLAEEIARGAYRPGEAAYILEGRALRDDEGNLMPGAVATQPSYDVRRVAPQLQALGPAGIAQLKSMAEGTAALRKLGVGAQEENPFTQFLADQTIPKNVQSYAQQLSRSFTTGALDPEKVDAKVKEVADMAQRAQQFEQNQSQIKANQDTMAALRSQGLENSRQALNIQQQNATLAAQNAAFNQQMRQAEIDRKAEERKNKPLPSYLAKEEEADYEKAQATTNLASDANNFINRIKLGEIPFGVIQKASIRSRQLFGANDPDVIAREDYDKFVVRLVNESLRLNKGTQTNFDFQQALKELQSSESKEAAASAMKRLLEVNLRATENAAKSVLSRRKNANFAEPSVPIEVPKFEPQIINNEDYASFLKNPKYPSGTVFVDPVGVRRVKP